MNEPQDPLTAAAKLCHNCEDASCPGLHSVGCWRARAFAAEKRLIEAELHFTDRAVANISEKLTLVLDGGWPGGSFADPGLNALMVRIRNLRTPAAPAPIPMLIWCPMCKARHLDVGEFATKVHHTHSCQNCGLTWRPAVVPTVGVQYLPGFKNEEPPKQ